jgi:plastocyanin
VTYLVQRVLAATGCLVLAVGCADKAQPGGASRTADGSSSPKSRDAVSIRLVAFSPPKLEVDAGAKVTWTQGDKGSVHTVTSGTVDDDATGATTSQSDGTFDSGELRENERFSFTFLQPGTYPYFCAIHQATMRGEVTVR